MKAKKSERDKKCNYGSHLAGLLMIRGGMEMLPWLPLGGLASSLGGLTSSMLGGLASLTVTLRGLLVSSLAALEGLTSLIVTLGGLISLIPTLRGFPSIVLRLGSSTSMTMIVTPVLRASQFTIVAP